MPSSENFDFDEDPTDFEGVSPPPHARQTGQSSKGASSLAYGTSAAGVRAFTTQLIAFYFRAPVWISGYVGKVAKLKQ